MDEVHEHLNCLETRLVKLHGEFQRLHAEVTFLRAQGKRAMTKENLMEGFIKYQSIEAFHPCFEHYKLCPDKPDTPNNFMCFTPTTHYMFRGSSSRPPVLAIREFKTHAEPEVVNIFETRHRVDLQVEFHSAEMEGFFGGVFKEGSEKISPTTYTTFVHVQNPEEFVRILRKKYRETMLCWDSLAET